MEFKEFLKSYFEAIKKEDKAFIKSVYQDWFRTSKVVPMDQEDYFYSMVFQDLKKIPDAELVNTESIGDFEVAHFKDSQGIFDLTFKKKGESWVFFNYRSNYSLFSKVYAINYDVKGGILRMLFNGKRNPLITDVKATSGVISMINSALVPGENELALESADGNELEVSIRVSSAKEGDIMNSAQGDVLNWNGKVKKPVKLKFNAE